MSGELGAVPRMRLSELELPAPERELREPDGFDPRPDLRLSAIPAGNHSAAAGRARRLLPGRRLAERIR
jgi:hypothetical protein